MRSMVPELAGGGGQPPRGNAPPRRKPVPPPKSKTLTVRKWKALNLTDARTDIDDDEVAWLENAMILGKGSIQILNGPGASVATMVAGSANGFGFTLNGSPILISVNTDGSISQVTTGGAITAVAPAGTVTALCDATMFQGARVLFVDPTKGYHTWDGAAFTTIDAARLGTSLAVFEGRVWIANNRTIAFTAPNSFNDFTSANGGGSFVLTDDAFPGNIIHMVSALEQLWVVGQGAIEALSNVAATGAPPNVVTTFSVTNVVTNLGSNSPYGIVGYFRALSFLAPFGIYALSGVTPQKLSDKLDGLFPQLTLSSVSAAVAVVQNLLSLLFLVTYTGNNAQSGAAPVTLLLGFSQGKWFFASQGTALKWVTTLIVGGVSQAWASDGSGIFQVFGAANSAPVVGKIQTKQFDFGASPTMKALTKAGFEYIASAAIPNTVLTLESDLGSEVIPVSGGNVLTFLNSVGATLQFLNGIGATLTFLTQGLVLSLQRAALFGHYIGQTITFNDPPYRIQALHYEYTMTREWSKP